MKNEHISWTSIDDLIEILQKKKADFGGDGTIPVAVNGISKIVVAPKPYFYDGGYFASDAKDPYKIKHSRKGKTINDGFHKNVVEIFGINPDDDYSLNGQTVVEIDPDSWEWLEKRQQEERNQFNGQLVKYENQKEKDSVTNCYPVKACVDSGEFAIGRSMKEAKENLLKLFNGKSHPGE